MQFIRLGILAVTLSHYPSVYEDMGESEREFAIKVQSGLLSVINDFLNSYWPELQVNVFAILIFCQKISVIEAKASKLFH